MPDEPNPAKKKRSKKSAASEAPPEASPSATPLNVENAIGTLGETRETESAGGDPNSPADRALESALLRESKLAAAIVTVNATKSDTALRAAVEYPGERDPLADSDAAPPATDLERTVEALLFAAEEPIAPREIARAADSDSATVRKVLAALKAKLDRERRPWELLEVANGYRLVTRAEFHPAILKLKTQTSQRKLTQAALETLALIAYKQPIGRAEIESVRGVNAGPVLRLLLEKKLIQISGRGESAGQPLLYGTTDYFLENFGLKNISELPKPGEFKNT